MKNTVGTKSILTLVFLMFAGLTLIGQAVVTKNIARNKPVTASSETGKYPGTSAVDGKVTRDSKWMTAQVAPPPHFLEIDLQKYFHINRVIVHTGIPENEHTSGENGQAPGFWAVKHFRLQYWDDANWTDIPKTEVTENRQTAAAFTFAPAILTYKLRFVAFDGEPLNVMELEVFGKEATGMSVPEGIVGSAGSDETEISSEKARDNVIIVHPKVIGKTMKYVAYNQAYYLPGSNVSGWLEYSGVNSLRVWTSLSTYTPVSCVQADPAITSLSAFEARKSELRKNPESNRFIRWEELKKIYSEIDRTGTNAMVFDYVLAETKRLGIEVLLQINERRFLDEWNHKWQQWQRFYALAYYAAREGDVAMFAMQNEPNHSHSGPMTVDEWLRGMQIVSDAVRCAVEDVNLKYGKQLTPKFVGPVTAGTNIDWWTEVVRNIRKDYRGERVDYDLIDIFSTHSYNSPAAGYATRVENIRKVIRENHPEGKELPVVYTEIGRWMNAYLIDKEETMDSPSLFTEWAGIYTNNMLNGAHGMWAFKFASNTSSAYPSGIKSGHHFTWNGRRLLEDAWNNLALGKSVKPGAVKEGFFPQNITDGDLSDHSSFVFDSAIKEKWLEINLLKEEEIGSAVIYTGSSHGVFTGPDRLKNFKLQYKIGSNWIDIPGASVSNCKYVQVLLEFEKPVKTQHVRLVAADEGDVKVREIKLFKRNEGHETATKSYDISGIHRTGEVVRLFAKGFKAQRDLLLTDVSAMHPGLDVCSSYDPKSGNHYIWLVQRSNFNYRFSIDLSKLNIPAGHPVIAEAVGPYHYGEVIKISETGMDSKVEIDLPAQTVMLVTIAPKENLKKRSVSAESAITVSGNNSPEIKPGITSVSLDGSNKGNNRVSYIHFDLSGNLQSDGLQLSVLGVNGFVDKGEEPMRVHVYGFPSNGWNGKDMTWENAPYLAENEALIQHVGSEVFIAGQLAFDQTEKYHYLDVTRHIQKYPRGITFILVRETRHMGDYGDKGRKVVISSVDSDKKPVLVEYFKNM